MTSRLYSDKADLALLYSVRLESVKNILNAAQRTSYYNGRLVLLGLSQYGRGDGLPAKTDAELGRLKSVFDRRVLDHLFGKRLRVLQIAVDCRHIVVVASHRKIVKVYAYILNAVFRINEKAGVNIIFSILDTHNDAIVVSHSRNDRENASFIGGKSENGHIVAVRNILDILFSFTEFAKYGSALLRSARC